MAASYHQRFKTVEQRFLESFTKGKQDECWVWNKDVLKNGYGRFFSRGKTRLAHRFSYQHFIGPIPDGMLVCHTCDNPPCVNPNHFFLGTYADNKHDCMAKKRHIFGSRHPATYTPGWCAGETSGRAKLTEQKVKDIRKIFSEGGISKAELGRQYGVTDVAISKIISRENWKHI